VHERGLAPTPLERYARCPFQYFAADVLRLEPVRWTVSQEPDAALLGTLCHAALKRCYEQLLPTGWPAEPVTDDTMEWCIRSAVDLAAQDCEARHRTGYYLLWELAKEHVVTLITAAVDADTDAYTETPFMPEGFELDAEGTIAGVLPDPSATMKIRGRVDRIDRHRDSRRFASSTTNSRPAGDEVRGSQPAAIRRQGYRLSLRFMPPAHARQACAKPGAVHVSGAAVRAARCAFDVRCRRTFRRVRRQIQQTLRMLVTGLQAGRFILPTHIVNSANSVSSAAATPAIVVAVIVGRRESLRVFACNVCRRSRVELIPDRQARDLAETTFDRNVVVVAGAGTGKTTLLVNRLVHLLIKEPCPVTVTQIVALTFTNKAATEMKVRLRERLMVLANPETEAARLGDGGAVSLADLRLRYGLSRMRWSPGLRLRSVISKGKLTAAWFCGSLATLPT
jgi:RecB family exonuclease